MSTPHRPAEEPGRTNGPHYAPRPAWVKWLLIAVAVLLLLLVVRLVAAASTGRAGPPHVARGG